ncbi:hypothetical protein E2C06_10445 [Dankookia rubra]|uniref:Uncharacterized protein n=1 Tax=Dankookia rubra TaxID=1442381 RepID=A0A4R5QHU7_9PROT|nr:hypothetical protein [Dankookia rubra]TDH62553.1 hypothetical protein E2C06_10445 [Dankookia rubra]
MNSLSPLPPPRGADPPSEAAPPRAAAYEPAGRPEAASPGLPNPSLRLDPALGLVVLEFRDRSGRTATLPTERELAAYRSARGRPEPTPPPPKPGAGMEAQMAARLAADTAAKAAPQVAAPAAPARPDRG